MAYRITPNIPDRAYQTFQIKSPISTHTVAATCEDVECEMYAKGWRMRIDLNTRLGQEQGRYIKYQSGRSYKIVSQQDGMVELEFAPNQPCFKEHRVRNDRPETFLVKSGDFRTAPRLRTTRVHKKPEFWVEEFAENQDRLKSAIEKG